MSEVAERTAHLLVESTSAVQAEPRPRGKTVSVKALGIRRVALLLPELSTLITNPAAIVSSSALQENYFILVGKPTTPRFVSR